MTTPQILMLPRLANPWVETKVAHQLLRFAKAGHVSDGRDDASVDHGIDACNGRKPLYIGVVYRVLCDLAVETRKVFCETVDLAHVAGDRGAFIIRHLLSRKPVPAALVEQIGMRTLRHEMGLKDRVHLVLYPRSMPNHLIASGDKPEQSSVRSSGTQTSGRKLLA